MVRKSDNGKNKRKLVTMKEQMHRRTGVAKRGQELSGKREGNKSRKGDSSAAKRRGAGLCLWVGGEAGI